MWRFAYKSIITNKKLQIRTRVDRYGQSLSTIKEGEFMIRISTLLTILRKYVGADRRNALDYCAYIFSLFMKEPETDEDIRLDETERYYPFTSEKQKSAAQKLLNGTRGITDDVARMISAHFDKSNFLTTIEALPYDAKMNLCQDLLNENVDCNDSNVSEVCAELFNSYIKEALGEPQPNNFGVVEKRSEVGEIIPPVPIHPVRYSNGKVYTGDSVIELSPYLQLIQGVTDDNLAFIDALMEVYSEKENRKVEKSDVSALSSVLKNHYSNQKKAYFSAANLEHRVRESFSDGDVQFGILKEDTFDCIEMVYFDDCYSNGYERLQAVLKQAANATPTKSALYNISGLYGALEKKGLCHIFVNERTIKSWVNPYEENI